MDVGPNPQLSAFWKRRMALLVSASHTNPVLSRRTMLALGTAGAFTCLLPTLRSAPLLAEDKKRADGGKSLSGRIFVETTCITMREAYKDIPGPEGIIAVDPQTGTWERIHDRVSLLRVSSGGKTITFFYRETSNGLPRPTGIWAYDLSTRQSVRILESGAPMCWSGDGRLILVTKAPSAKKDESQRWDTWLVSADGSQRTKVPIPDTDEVDDWSPDGKWLVTVSDRHPPFGSGYQLYRMRPDGTDQLRLTKDGLNCYPRFSPDSRRIVYLHQTGKAGNSLHVVNVDGSDDREILHEEGMASVEAACWSPDGSHLAVVRYDWGHPEGVNIALPRGDKEETNDHRVGQHDSRIEIMDPDGKNRREIRLAKRDDIWLGHPHWR
jgi:Tol biopolymer transport system component